ncbi:helix-turn-helix transcriptional regulator [Micromonospora sp. NPDC051196]|uniref:helix-turn-helix transcriptional regulator n=1 Tax=Micromonospora sp. NPDC051196 TaxID=3155281 RepID=UPI003437CB7D
MRLNLAKELTVDDMARIAMFSKFHFTRVFQRMTGISPRRFLSAIRLQEAKRLLISTELTVADISLRVGYHSVGTFSTRFTKSVGLSPTAYRQFGGYTPIVRSRPRQLRGNTISGVVHGTPRGLIFMGVFPHRIPEGSPVACRVLERPGPYQFNGIPNGTFYVLCQAVAGSPFDLEPEDVVVATAGPVTVSGNGNFRLDPHLQPVSKLDPPVLLALLDSRMESLRRAGKLSRNAWPAGHPGDHQEAATIGSPYVEVPARQAGTTEAARVSSR